MLKIKIIFNSKNLIKIGKIHNEIEIIFGEIGEIDIYGIF